MARHAAPVAPGSQCVELRRLNHAVARSIRTLSGLGVLFVLAPFVFHGEFQITFLTLALYVTLLGVAWNMLGGFAGQYSFGHAIFFGVGAYAAAIVQVQGGLNAWFGWVAGMCLGGLAGAAVGAVSFRYGLRGSYFALVTLAIAEVCRIIANSISITGAGVGMMIPLQPGLAHLQFAGKLGYYYWILAMVTVALALSSWVRHSRFGAALAAVRDNEESARALGIDATALKVMASALSGALMASAGVFYLQYFHYIDPTLVFGPAVSVQALLAAIVGGLGSVLGPLIGAIALAVLNEIGAHLFGGIPEFSMVLYGILLILIVRFMPHGLARGVAPLVRRLRGASGRREDTAGA